MITTIAKFFKEEKDLLFCMGYKKGIEKGEIQKSRDVVENLIVKLGLSDEQTGDVAAVPIAFVVKVRRSLNIKKAF